MEARPLESRISRGVKSVGHKSPSHSLGGSEANRQSKLVLRPDSANYPGSEENHPMKVTEKPAPFGQPTVGIMSKTVLSLLLVFLFYGRAGLPRNVSQLSESS